MPSGVTPRHRSFWGDGINYDGPGCEVVRAFMIHNALYWLEEYHLDGLRLDAVNAIVDDSPTHLLVELGRAVADGPGRERSVHLVLENGANESGYLERAAGGRPLYVGQQLDVYVKAPEADKTRPSARREIADAADEARQQPSSKP